MKKQHLRIGQIFVKSGFISEDELEILLEENQKNPHEKLGETLIRLNFATEKDLASALSFQLGVSYIDLNNAVIEPQAIKLIPLKLAKESCVIPVYLENNYLILAMKDPLDLNAIDMARFASGKNIRPHVAIENQIREAINLHYNLEELIDNVIKNTTQDAGVELIGEELFKHEGILELKRKSELAPVIKLVNSIMSLGISSRASDIHIEPQEKEVFVRNRIDGIMTESMRIPKWVQGALTSRIKIMAGMNIAERRIPQDGRIKLKMENKNIDLRISTLPAQYGEKVVIRILETDKNIFSLWELGLLPDQIAKVNNLINLSQGMILVCGPTGGGKTTTIYSLIGQIIKKNINIMTLEDPIEYRMNGVNQVQINEKRGMTFAKALRSVLRQDPDVVFVGEIRDGETAQIAMRASLTGHLVISTVHTIDAPSTITRLKDLEIESYLIASSLTGIIFQRLIRMICNHCREEYEPSPEILEKIKARLGEEVSFLFYHGKGCNRCKQTGYRGRIGVFEILTLDGDIRKLISRNAPEGEIREVANNKGMKFLIEDALEKIRQGITTIEEVERVLFISEEIEQVSKLKCHNCKNFVDPRWEFCPLCRHDLKVTQAVRVAAITNPAAIRPQPAVSRDNDLEGYKILLVGDDEELIKGLSFFLLKNHFILSTATNGKKALESIARDKPHLVITDIIMPEMDSLELIKKMRQDITMSFIPVIILSKKRDVQDKLKGFETEADEYIPKPFSLDDLLLRSRAVLKRAYKI